MFQFITIREPTSSLPVRAIDNMVKGAAGQAIQNMNIIFGLDEKTGFGNRSACFLFLSASEDLSMGNSEYIENGSVTSRKGLYSQTEFVPAVKAS